MNFLYSLTLALILAPTAAVAQDAARQRPLPEPPPATGTVMVSTYRIGPMDTLLITVVDEAELTGKFSVDGDGMFSYPYLNRVKAAGLTATELQTELASLLRNGYLRNPQVRVEVDLFRSQSVMVIGEVRQPGKIPMT